MKAAPLPRSPGTAPGRSPVADHHPERRAGQLEHRPLLPGSEVGNELGPAPHEPDQSRQRHVLAERDEVNLIILGRNACPFRKNALFRNFPGPSRLSMEPTRRGVSTPPTSAVSRPRSAGRHGERWSPPSRATGRRRAGRRTVASQRPGGLPREALVHPHDLLVANGVPLHGLLDGGLDHGHRQPTGRACLGVPIRPERTPPETQRRHEEQPRGQGPATGTPPAEPDHRREGCVHREEQEGYPVDTRHLGDLDHRKGRVLGVARRAPGKPSMRWPRIHSPPTQSGASPPRPIQRRHASVARPRPRMSAPGTGRSRPRARRSEARSGAMGWRCSGGRCGRASGAAPGRTPCPGATRQPGRRAVSARARRPGRASPTPTRRATSPPWETPARPRRPRSGAAGAAVPPGRGGPGDQNTLPRRSASVLGKPAARMRAAAPRWSYSTLLRLTRRSSRSHTA